MKYQSYLRIKNLGIPELAPNDEPEQLRLIVNRLIEHLYTPAEQGWVVSEWATKQFGDEAINWGDLGCVDVKHLADGRFWVTVAEADPGAVKLRDYIKEWLGVWGWPADVVMEW